MKRFRRVVLLMAGGAALVSLLAACTSDTPAATETPSLTVTNVQMLTPTPTLEPSPTSTLAFSPTSEQPQGDATLGGEVFSVQCAVCHGADAGGGLGPALNTAAFTQEFPDDADITDVLRNGSGGMPAYGSDRLTDQQVLDLVAYVRSLQ